MMDDLTDQTFDDALHDAPAGALLLVDFWADWCGPCKNVGPLLEILAAEYEGRVRFARVNAEQNRRLMEAFGVKALPSVLLLAARENGADVVGHLVGSQPRDTYVALIERALNPPPTFVERLKGLFAGRSE